MNENVFPEFSENNFNFKTDNTDSIDKFSIIPILFPNQIAGFFEYQRLKKELVNILGFLSWR